MSLLKAPGKSFPSQLQEISEQQAESSAGGKDSEKPSSGEIEQKEEQEMKQK